MGFWRFGLQTAWTRALPRGKDFEKSVNGSLSVPSFYLDPKEPTCLEFLIMISLSSVLNKVRYLGLR